MTQETQLVFVENIQSRIFTIRHMQVMIDSDLAEMYGVSTGRLNEQAKRNIERFPVDFMFQLTTDEWQNLKSQNAILSWGGRRVSPYVFTEQGISSLSAVLKSDIAVKVHITIMRAFVQMRRFLAANGGIFQRVDKLELKQIETDSKIEKALKLFESKNAKPTQGIFFDGQIFDAYLFVTDLVKNAKSSIILIDNYVDESILSVLSKRKKGVKALIYTANLTKQLRVDLKKHNEQYPTIEIKPFTKSHDRFLIIDKRVVYHIGASLKDLGKKWFAFSKIDLDAIDMIKRLENAHSK